MEISKSNKTQCQCPLNDDLYKIIIIIIMFCPRAGLSLQTQAPRLNFCSKAGLPLQTQEPRLQFYLGWIGAPASRCFPHLTLSLASKQTLKDMKRSQGHHIAPPSKPHSWVRQCEYVAWFWWDFRWSFDSFMRWGCAELISESISSVIKLTYFVYAKNVLICKIKATKLDQIF